MQMEDLFRREALLDLSFFNFRNAVTACYFADRDLRILKVNDNFKAFFPVLGNVANAYFPDVLRQLGVASEQIDLYVHSLATDGRVIIPQIPITMNGSQRVFALTSTYTHDETFSLLNGLQGQFIDRTEEFRLTLERQQLLEEKLRDRELIEEKTRELQRVADRLAKYLSPQIYGSIFSGQQPGRRSADPQEPDDLLLRHRRLHRHQRRHGAGTPLLPDQHLPVRDGGHRHRISAARSTSSWATRSSSSSAIPDTNGDREDALRCARMALRMRERVKELESLWSENGICRPLRVRMGITTGYCTVGNFGSEHRLEYTVLGSPVNLAARLQTAAAPDTILISESTYALLKDVDDCERMEDMKLKGFARPVGCYRLNDLANGETENASMTRIGRHVAVNIPDRRRIREAIIELRRIEQELEEHLPKA